MARASLRRIAIEKGEQFVVDLVDKKDATDKKMREEVIECYMKTLKVDSLEEVDRTKLFSVLKGLKRNPSVGFATVEFLVVEDC